MTEPLTVQQAAQRILEAEDILILSHKNPDGDTIGSASALYHGLTQLGRRAAVLCSDELPARYGLYCAQIAMGADQAQTLKAIREAEAYDGPSIIIAYAPCINHGIKAGMGKSQQEEAKAVACGYWHLWRYNPALEDEGKNPFIHPWQCPHRHASIQEHR